MAKQYRIFTGQGVINSPYLAVRTLSNGEVVGKFFGNKITGSMTATEVIQYIKDNNLEADVII